MLTFSRPLQNRIKFILYSVLFAVILIGCATVSDQIGKIARFIDGQDRIEMQGSTAEVTELVPQAAPTLAPAPEIDAIAKADPATQKVAKPADEPKAVNKPKPVQIAKPAPPPKAPVTKAKIKHNKPPEQKVDTQKHSLSGRVLVQIPQKNAQEKPETNASIVRLIPTAAYVTATPQNARPRQHVIDMKDKTYQPQYLIAQVDETVVFTNSDEIRHNVFSRSGKNAFDLGTFAGGKKRGVTFKEPGIVKVYCNIHPDMATFVSVTEKGMSRVTDEQGRFDFKDIPSGNYMIEAWNIRGSVSANIDLTEAAEHDIELVINTIDPDFEGHKNKFGETYPDKPALFKDEFY